MSDVFLQEELLRRCMGNAQLAERVVTTFRSSFEQDFENLERFVSHFDMEGVRKTAHKMKGSAGNAAAPTLRAAAAKLEKAASEGKFNRLRKLIESMRDEYRNFQDFAESTS